MNNISFDITSVARTQCIWCVTCCRAQRGKKKKYQQKCKQCERTLNIQERVQNDFDLYYPIKYTLALANILGMIWYTCRRGGGGETECIYKYICKRGCEWKKKREENKQMEKNESDRLQAWDIFYQEENVPSMTDTKSLWVRITKINSFKYRNIETEMMLLKLIQ